MTQEQFDRYFINYRPSLNRLARYLCRNNPDAEDLVQDTFLQGRATYPTLARDASLRLWLRRILCNTFYSRMRTTTAARLRRFGQRNVPLPPETADARYMPHRQFHLTQDIRTIRCLLAKIPATNRIPLVLRVCRNHSYARIARGLGIPVGTVRSRISRARIQFRRLLLPENCRRDEGAAPPSILALE